MRGALCPSALLASPDPDWPYRPLLRSLIYQAFARFSDQYAEPCASEAYQPIFLPAVLTGSWSLLLLRPFG